jgi:hypothetical protein
MFGGGWRTLSDNVQAWDQANVDLRGSPTTLRALTGAAGNRTNDVAVRAESRGSLVAEALNRTIG